MNIDEIDIPAHLLDLVWVDYDDGFSPGQVEKLIHGDWPDDTDEWISARQWEAANALATELLGEDADDDDHYALVERIQELDTSNPWRDLMRNTGMTLFRVSPDEDHMPFLCDELDDPAAACDALGLDVSFLPAVIEILPEIAGYKCEGGAHFGATIVFSANPADLWNVGPEGRIRVSDPFLWLCNPWAGNGYGVVAEGCRVQLDIADVHVDQFAWGYSAADVFGGLYLPDSTVERVDVGAHT